MTNVEYNEDLHQYKIDGEIVPSVTELAKQFSGLNTEWLEKHPEFAERGTIMHNQLADFYKNGVVPTDEKALAITELIMPSKAQQVEALVYNKTLKYAGTVDMLVMDGKVCKALIDFKSGENGNKRYYRCQLSLYLWALSDMGVDISGTKMFIVTPHGAQAFEPLFWDEMKAMSADMASKISPDDEDLREIEDLEEQVATLAPYVQNYNELKQKLSEKLSAMFVKTGTRKYMGSNYQFSYTPESTRFTFDSKLARLMLGDEAGKCDKEVKVAGSVRMTEIKGITDE